MNINHRHHGSRFNFAVAILLALALIGSAPGSVAYATVAELAVSARSTHGVAIAPVVLNVPMAPVAILGALPEIAPSAETLATLPAAVNPSLSAAAVFTDVGPVAVAAEAQGFSPAEETSSSLRESLGRLFDRAKRLTGLHSFDYLPPAAPGKISHEGAGLHRGKPFLSGKGNNGGTTPPVPPSNDEGDKTNWRAVNWMFVQGWISIVAFVMTSLAFPHVAMTAVSQARFGELMAWTGVTAMVTGPLNGIIAHRLSPRAGMVTLAIARGLLALALPVMTWTGIIGFWPMLVAAVGNGWALSALATSEPTYNRGFISKVPERQKADIDLITSLNTVRYVGTTVAMTLLIGIGSYINSWNPMTPFVISAFIHLGVVAPLVWLTLPGGSATAASIRSRVAAALHEEAIAFRRLLRATFARKNILPAILLTAAVGLYAFGAPAVAALHLVGHAGIGTTIGVTGALLFWISRSPSFRAVWSDPERRGTMTMSALIAGIMFSVQSLLAPWMATALSGAAGLSQQGIYAEIIGAMFFGQLIGATNLLKLPTLTWRRFDLKIPLQKILLAFVPLTAAAWSWLRLFPGLALPAAVVALSAAAILAAAHIPHRATWISLAGIGLTAATMLPFLMWGYLPAILLGMLTLGLFASSALNVLASHLSESTSKDDASAVFGANASLVQGTNSLAYGVTAMIAPLFVPLFPGIFQPFALAAIAVGVILYFFSRRLAPNIGKINS